MMLSLNACWWQIKGLRLSHLFILLYLKGFLFENIYFSVVFFGEGLQKFLLAKVKVLDILGQHKFLLLLGAIMVGGV